MRAKLVNEAIKHLSPRSNEQIISSFPESWNLTKAAEFLRSKEISFEINFDTLFLSADVINFDMPEFDNDILLYYVKNEGWGVYEQFNVGDVNEGLTWPQARKILSQYIEQFKQISVKPKK